MTKEQIVSSDKALEHRVSNYLKVTRWVRWILIAVVAVSFPFLADQNVHFVFVLLVLAVLYNAVLHIPAVLKQKWITAKPAILTIDCLFIYLLVWQSNGGLGSPYVSLFIFPIVSSAFWYGIAASVIAGAAESVITISLLWSQTAEDTRYLAIREFVFRMLLFVLLGMYVGYLTRSERRERLDLAEKDMQINQERQQLMALINNMNDCVLVINEAGSIVMFNDSAAKLAGSQYALIGKPLTEVFPLTDSDDQLANVLSIGKNASVRRRDLKMQMHDGTTLNIESDISPYIVNQKSRGFIVILRDITKQKTLEEEQEEFISVASHELRTPVTIVEAGISTTLASPNAPTDPTIRHLLEQAHENISFLSNIIDDLTTLSRAEQDRLEVDVDPLNPKEILEELAGLFRTQAHAKHLELKTDVPENIRPIISSHYRIKQILQNLVVNALKYTQEGSITLTVKNAERDQDGIIFSVADTGIGISVADQKNIFKKFFRSEDYRTRESGGTGLGLYISSKLADRLNAKIWFDSELKKGSTFYVQVPPYSRRKEDHGKVLDAEAKSFFDAL